MKRFLALFFAMIFSLAFAADADYFSVNVGAKNGVFSKTATPKAGYITTVVKSKPATADVALGTFVLYTTSTSSSCSLNFICKDVSGNIVSGNIK